LFFQRPCGPLALVFFGPLSFFQKKAGNLFFFLVNLLMKISSLSKLVITLVAALLILKAPAIFGLPVPRSLLFMYLFFILVVALLVLTSSPGGMEGLLRPLEAFFNDTRLRGLRNVVLALLPLVAGVMTYLSMGGGTGLPVEARRVHTAPPRFIRAYGKTFNLQTLRNPLREVEKSDPAAFRSLVREGGVVYFKNCLYCHGALLGGRGHLSAGMNPKPLPFAGRNTIAQLREAYLFWRIVKGGAGLPAEAAPWDSVMPAWEGMLHEEDVWKVILFLYDFTGNRPLKWD
jgi:mono/diheme cytochrome c family protein